MSTQPPDAPNARPVLVHWLDAGMGDTVEDASAFHRKSCGYLLKRQTNVGVWLGIDNEAVRLVEFIPWGMIEKIEPLVPDRT